MIEFESAENVSSILIQGNRESTVQEDLPDEIQLQHQRKASMPLQTIIDGSLLLESRKQTPMSTQQKVDKNYAII